MKIKVNKKLLQFLTIAGLSIFVVTTTQCGGKNNRTDVTITDTDQDDYGNSENHDNQEDIEIKDDYSDLDDYSKEKKENEKENENSHIDQTMKEVMIYNTTEFQDYFDSNVDFSDVEDAISLNENLTSKDKKRFLKLVKRLEEKTPTIDLRCLYENFKLLSFQKELEDGIHSNPAARFDKKNHSIYMTEDTEKNLNCMGLRMINQLVLEQEDENILLNRKFSNRDNSNFFLDGFYDWFSVYLFDYKKISNPIQYADIDTIKYILDLNNAEFIQTFTNENASSIISLLEQYLTTEEVNKFMEIGQKEWKNEDKKKKITKEEMSRKYSLLLKACITSRGSSISSDEMYQIMNKLSNSYKRYSEVYEEEISVMTEEFLSILRSKVDYTENDIVLLDHENKEIEYCNINQMNMIELENGSIYIGEEYLNENGEKCYFLGDSAYKAKDEDIITPVVILLNREDDWRTSYTTSDLATMYFEYMGYNQGEKQAVKK